MAAGSDTSSAVDCVALIPARGGSKGVPRKNVLPLVGRPLLAWTIEAALRAQSVDRVYVSTDDDEIAQVSIAAGAEVINRPNDLASDSASSESALLHALDVLEGSLGALPSYTTFLQCTSPLTVPSDIDGVLACLQDGADSALAVTPFHHFLWSETYDGAEGINHDKSVRLRRQDMEPQWLETGSVYAFRSAEFRARKHRFFGKVGLYRIDPERVLEIDEPADFEAADARIKALGW